MCWLGENRSGSPFYSSLNLSPSCQESVYGTTHRSSRDIPNQHTAPECLCSSAGTHPQHGRPGGHWPAEPAWHGAPLASGLPARWAYLQGAAPGLHFSTCHMEKMGEENLALSLIIKGTRREENWQGLASDWMFSLGFGFPRCAEILFHTCLPSYMGNNS